MLCRLPLVVTLLSAALAPIALAADPLPVAAPEQVGMSAEKLALVDAAMKKLVDDAKIAGGVVMVARHGKVVHFRAYGMADIEADAPMKTDSIVRIYSMTKAIATAAALMLVDEGKLDLDAPVARYIPQLRGMKVHTPNGPVAPDHPMTVRDLMRHTSGLVYGFGSGPVNEAYRKNPPLDAKDLNEMADRLATVPLAFEPGTQWEYSIATDVLGAVIERVSGKPLDQFLDDRLFKPLGMTDTGFHVPADKLPRFAANYGPDGPGNLKVIDRPADSKWAKPTSFFSAGGGLVATAEDYMRFLLMIRNGGHVNGKQLLKPDTVKLMTTNQLPHAIPAIRFGNDVRHGVGFGLGFSVFLQPTDFDKAAPVGEYGWGGAASTHYWVSPKDDLAVVTLEQRMPYTFETEFLLKPLIYAAITSR